MTPNIRSLSRSFTGGVVTPEFFGRIDDVKYQTGLSVCRNWIVKPHGPLANRGGLALVSEVKDSTKRTRLIPFVAANDQSAVIEIGAGYFRFHTQGATLLDAGVPYEVANPYAEADLFGIRYVQSNDVMTLTHPGHPPAELRRAGATDWTYAAISFASRLAAPTGVSATATPTTTSPGTPTLQSYVVTAVSGRDEGPPSSLGLSAGGQPIGGFAISAVTKASPILVTSHTGSSLVPAEGAEVFISGVGGMAELNGKYFTVYNVTPIVEDVVVADPTPPTGGGLDDPRGGYYSSGGAIP